MEYIKIGKIVNTHGIKGELKIQSYSDFDALRYKKGNTVYIHYEGEYLPFVTETFRVHKGFSLVSFTGKANINFVECYKGSDIYIARSDRHALKEGEYYRDQYIGLHVIDEDGNEIGVVEIVEDTNPKQSHFRIHREGKNDALVPNIPFFVKKVDLENQTLTIHVEEGLL